MVHHLLNQGALVNQRDRRFGMTALHRAAFLAHCDGYLELYEYLLSRGADPSIASNDYEPYLNPGPKLPRDLCQTPAARASVEALERQYAGTPRQPLPHPDVGDW